MPEWRQLFPGWQVFLSRNAWPVAGGNLCSVLHKYTSINRGSGKRTSAYKICVSEHVWLCVREWERKGNKGRRKQIKPVTRESWTEGERENVAEEGAMAWWRGTWRQSDKNRGDACSAAETSLLIPAVTLTPLDLCVYVCVYVEVYVYVSTMKRNIQVYI